MTSSPDSLLSVVGGLIALLMLAGFVALVVLAIAGASRTTKRQATRDSAESTRRPGEGPLWAERRVEMPELDTNEEEGASLPAELPYTRRRYLLSQAERDFFAVLRAAAPEGWYVFPQVRLANLMMLKKGTRNWKPHFSRVAQKCVDFVLCDAADISPRLVVELDDSSHDRPDRQARDAFVDAALRSAGLPILHVRWQRRYDPAALAGQIQLAAGLRSPTTATPVSRPAPPAAGVPPTTAPAPITRPAPFHSTTVATVPQTTTVRWACRSCGAQVGERSKFCSSCGSPLEL